MSNVPQKEICTTSSQVLAPTHAESITNVLSAALNSSEQGYLNDLLTRVRKEDGSFDLTLLKKSDRRRLGGVLEDTDIMDKLTVALTTELQKTSFAGASFGDIKEHIASLQLNKELFYNEKNEVDPSILIKSLLTISGSSSESVETLSGTIDAAYLDELATQTSNTKHKEQLGNMKVLLATNPNCTIKKERLKVRKDGVLLIDGHTVPSDLVDNSKKPGYENKGKGYQKYDDMNVSGSKFLYAEGMLCMLRFFGEMGGKEFAQGTLNSTNLTDKLLSKEEILKKLRSGDNNTILEDVSKVLNLEGYFPIGIDIDGYIIYALVRPDDIGFYCDISRHDYYNCLASSNGDETPLNGGVS